MTNRNEKEPLKDAAKATREIAERTAETLAEPVQRAAHKAIKGLQNFADLEAAGGIGLVSAGVIALLVSNSSMAEIYNDLLSTKIAINVGTYGLGKSVLHWVNDGLMAIFFFVIGLEMKREFYSGDLNSISKIALPLVAAIGGIIVPIAVFTFINMGDTAAMRGWAIPVATDTAFALGVLALLGSGVPKSLSIFLLSLAVFDDIAAVLIIAIFFGNGISKLALITSAGIFLILLFLNLAGIRRISVYVVAGAILWLAVVEAGVHATIAGVLLAMTIPIENNDNASPLVMIEDSLHPWVVFVILPIVAFVNAGVPLDGLTFSSLTDGLTMGILLSLVLGKPIGVFTASLLLILLGSATLPRDVNWTMFAGVCTLAGIGFTMSLFIGSLAFDAPEFEAQIRLGVLGGSLIAATSGFLILATQIKRNQK